MPFLIYKRDGENWDYQGFTSDYRKARNRAEHLSQPNHDESDYSGTQVLVVRQDGNGPNQEVAKFDGGVCLFEAEQYQ